jgi:enoyl-CoA hydratase/carnithine racemase
MSGGLVDMQREGAVLLLRYDPGEAGVMRGSHAPELLAAFEAAIADDDGRAIVFAGARPGVFIRHYDVASIMRSVIALREGRATIEDFDETPLTRLYDLCASAPKPIVAAINGVCMGGGFEFALCCTSRIAQADVTQIGLPESRIGLFPGAGGTQRLPRLIGEARALSFILSGSVVDAAGALSLGLVDAVAEDAVAHALAVARSWASRSPMLLASILRLVRGACDRPIAEGLAGERRAFASLLRDDGAASEEMRRFLDRDTGLGEYRR